MCQHKVYEYYLFLKVLPCCAQHSPSKNKLILLSSSIFGNSAKAFAQQVPFFVFTKPWRIHFCEFCNYDLSINKRLTKLLFCTAQAKAALKQEFGPQHFASIQVRPRHIDCYGKKKSIRMCFNILWYEVPYIRC